jgi:hypothetical protein
VATTKKLQKYIRENFRPRVPTMKLISMRASARNAVALLLFVVPFFVGLPLLTLNGCSSEPEKSHQAAVKPPEYVTGRVGFQKMYAAARGWSPDVEGFRLTSTLTSDSQGHEGKSGMWSASFASPAKHNAKPYVWSGSNAPEAPERGVTWGSEDSYSPTNTSTKIFDLAFLKIDSDAALQTAMKHGGDKLMEKDANQPVMYLLEFDGPSNELLWHVIFGTSRNENKLQILVDASSGEFVRVEK